MLPPVSVLEGPDVMYHFVQGFTSKLAGTEVGLGQPEATFSACFGAPFMAHRPNVYAELLKSKMDRHRARGILLNTGWSGGPAGKAARMPIRITRALLDAALRGDLHGDGMEYETHPIFRLRVPKHCPGVDPRSLNPRDTWGDGAEYDATAARLRQMFPGELRPKRVRLLRDRRRCCSVVRRIQPYRGESRLQRHGSPAGPATGSELCMNVHEYQAKDLLRGYGVAVPRGRPAFTVDEAVAAAEAIGGGPWVVKAQIHAGGRGAGRFAGDPDGNGGVRLAASLAEVRTHTEAMLGNVLVTRQTGTAGRTVRRLYVEEGCDIARELYLSLLVDRGAGRVVVMASAEGGMDVEEVAAETPERILTITIDPATGLQPFHARRVAFGLGLAGGAARAGAELVTSLYRALVELDASIVEVNPLVVTGGGGVTALDAKMSFDDNALYRHPEIASLRDEDEEDPAEVEAGRHDLNYVALDGEIGCMVNGAGLAMATMDLTQAPRERARELSGRGGKRDARAGDRRVQDHPVRSEREGDPGQHLRRDHALRRRGRGVSAAAREVDLSVPLVVRLEGTNVEIGKSILADSGLPILSADGLEDAARKVVDAVRARASGERD